MGENQISEFVQSWKNLEKKDTLQIHAWDPVYYAYGIETSVAQG
jgi:hypothetical protein